MRLHVTLCSIAAAAVLAGCSLFNSTSTTSKKDYSRSQVDGAGSSLDKSQNTTQVAVDDLKSQLYGEWNLLTVNGKDVSTSERAYINLDFNANKMYGCNGCNISNADFQAAGSGIEFSNLISTRMSCVSATPESTVMKAIEDTRSFKLYQKNGTEYLHLINGSGGTVATLRRQNLDYANGAWTVKEINGTPTINDNVRIVIDTDQLKLHGNTGCNVVNGTIYIDTDKENAIQFQQLISTLKSCPDMKIETELLVALEETCFCNKVSDTEIELLDAKGNVVVTLTRLYLAQN